MANGRPRVTKSRKSVYRVKKVVHAMQDRFYKEVCSPRRQEMADSNMLQEDHNAIANLSNDVINRQFNPGRFMESLGKYDGMDEIGK